MSDSAKTPPEAPYVPAATAASERMLDSLLGRVVGADQTLSRRSNVRAGLDEPMQGAAPRRTAAPRVLATPVAEAVTAGRPVEEDSPAAPHIPPPLTVLENWQAPEVSRGGMRAQEAAGSNAPLWGALAPVKLEPVMAALESALGSSSSTARSTASGSASTVPNMTLLQGGSRPAPAGSPTNSSSTGNNEGRERGGITKAAVDASARLLDVLRAHAAAHATAGDDRVTLKDMTFIAHADQKRQMAAAATDEHPQPKESEPPVGDLPNPKVNANQFSMLHVVTELATKLMDDDNKDQENADTRFGQA